MNNDSDRPRRRRTPPPSRPTPPRSRAFPPWLWALFAAAFVLYTDDYVIAGLLPELAADLGVTESTAGQLVTVFSVVIAIAAPVAAVVFAKVPRRLLFTVTLVTFAVANIAAALTPSYGVLVALRIVAAAAAASTAPAIFAFTAKNAPPRKSGTFIAIVSLGTVGAIAAGVPIGTWIGGALGWRATFAVMAVAGVAALAAVLRTIPARSPLDDPPRLIDQIRILRRLPISLGLVANSVLMTGSMMLFTYLAPFFADTVDAGVNARALAFSVAGVAGVAGIWLGGFASDRWGPDRTLIFGVAVFVATMLALWGLWLIRPAPLAAALAVGAVWGGMAFWNFPAIQARLNNLAGPVAPQALALNTSGTYLGIAAGGAIGGATLAASGAGALPLVAAACGLLSLVLIGAASRASSWV